MMRDMSNLYFSMSMKELKTLRSKKILAIERERTYYRSYSGQQEIKRLVFAISRIDAVIAARLAQMELPE
jgi:nucleoside phosphorylase